MQCKPSKGDQDRSEFLQNKVRTWHCSAAPCSQVPDDGSSHGGCAAADQSGAGVNIGRCDSKRCLTALGSHSPDLQRHESASRQHRRKSGGCRCWGSTHCWQVLQASLAFEALSSHPNIAASTLAWRSTLHLVWRGRQSLIVTASTLQATGMEAALIGCRSLAAAPCCSQPSSKAISQRLPEGLHSGCLHTGRSRPSVLDIPVLCEMRALLS